MKILSHRGYWLQTTEKNTEEAFKRSFDLGFGTETDIRDLAGELVISHDMPLGNEKTLEAFLNLLQGKNLPLAINIKSDGLAKLLNKIMVKKEIKDWFVFDMSIPDTKLYIEEGIPVFIRASELEIQPPWLNLASGIWLDSFHSTWFNVVYLKSLFESVPKVCIVSPELHKRDYLDTWEMLLPLRKQSGLMLCTDHPEKAKIFFGANDD